MALPIQQLFIPISGLHSGDIGEKLLSPGAGELVLENAVFNKVGEVIKRDGGSNIQGITEPGDAIVPRTWQLTNYKNALTSLSITGQNPISTRSTNASTWTNCNATNSAITTKRRTNSLTAMPERVGPPNAWSPHMAYGTPAALTGSVYALTWRAQVSTFSVVHQAVVDATNYNILWHRVYGDTSILASAAIRMCAIVGNYAVFVYSLGGNFYFDKLDMSTWNTPTSTNTSSANHSQAPGTFDILVRGTVVSIVYARITTDIVLGVDYDTSDDSLTSWTLHDDGASTVSADYTVCWVKDSGSSGKYAVCTADSSGEGGSISIHWDIPTTGSTRQAASSWTIDNNIGEIGNLTAITTSSDTSGDLVVCADVLADETVEIYTSINGGDTTTSETLRSCVLFSQAWLHSSEVWVAVERVDPELLITTRYIINCTSGMIAAPQATFDIQNGYWAQAQRADLMPVVSIDTNTLAVPSTTVRRLTGQSADFGNPAEQGARGINIVKLSYNVDPNTTIGKPIETLDNLFVPGGVLQQFDGATYAEAGFPYRPPQPTLAGGTTGSLTAGGTYYYRIVYAYFDSNGRIWRSEPCTPTGLSLTESQNKITLTIPTLRITGRTDILIEIYRTANNDTSTYQKITHVANSLTSDTTSYQDTTADSSLATGEFGYWVGGQVENAPIPGCSFVCEYKNRVFFVSNDDPEEIWYSADMREGEGLIFNNSFKMRCKSGGPITGLGVIGNTLIIFKQESIWAVFGGAEGPNRFGQNPFPEPQLLIEGTGTKNRQSIVDTAQGLFFYKPSLGGIHLLNAGLGLEFVGAPIQGGTGLTSISSAVSVPAQDQVRFFTSQGTTYVYDTRFKQWSTFTSQPTASATTYGASFDVCRASNTADVSDGYYHIVNEVAGLYTDDGTAFDMRIRTPWLSLAGISGFQRLYCIQPIGSVNEACTVTARLYYDFDDSSANQTLTFNFSDTADPMDLEIRPSKQLCSSVMLELTEDPVAPDTATEAIVLNGISLEYGSTPGLRRLAANRRMT